MKNTLFNLSASRTCKRIHFPGKIQSADLAKLINSVLSKEIKLSSDLVIKRDCDVQFELEMDLKMSECFVRLTMTHFHFLLTDNSKYEFYRIIGIDFI